MADSPWQQNDAGRWVKRRPPKRTHWRRPATEAEWSVGPRLLELSDSRGWLAVTDRDHPYDIGVIGPTPEAARELFAIARGKWRELHGRVVAERQRHAELP